MRHEEHFNASTNATASSQPPSLSISKLINGGAGDGEGEGEIFSGESEVNGGAEREDDIGTKSRIICRRRSPLTHKPYTHQMS